MTAHPCPYGAHCPAVYAAIAKKVGSVLHLLKQDHVHSRLEWDEDRRWAEWNWQMGVAAWSPDFCCPLIRQSQDEDRGQ